MQDVRTGTASAEFGTVIVLYLLSSRPDRRGVYSWSHVIAAATLNRPADVIGFADMLSRYAASLREVADELVIAQQQDQTRVEADLKGAGREG